MLRRLLALMKKAAAPVFMSSATTIDSSSGTTDVFNMPSGIVVGDCLIALADRPVGTTTYTGTGWTAITGQPTGSIRAFWRIADGTEGATQTFTANSSGTAIGLVMRISGANGSPIDVATWGTIRNAATFTGTASFTTNVMTVTVATTGTLHVGDQIGFSGAPNNTYISSFGTGTGGVGTYNLSTSPGTIAAESVIGNLPSITAASITPNVSNGLLLTNYFTDLGGTVGFQGSNDVTTDAAETIINSVTTTAKNCIKSAYKQLSSNAPTATMTGDTLLSTTTAYSLNIIIKP